MTVIPARNLAPEEINHLGGPDLQHEIRDDHDQLHAQQRMLDALGEPEVTWLYPD